MLLSVVHIAFFEQGQECNSFVLVPLLSALSKHVLTLSVLYVVEIVFERIAVLRIVV